MTQYLIKRLDQGGGYLAPSGSQHSWIKDKAKAQRFETYDAADRERCPDNEIVVEL